MERTNANTLRIAEFLAAHPRVTRTIYPGLASHPHHALAARQMQGFGGLMSFDVGSLDRAREVLGRFRLMALAESLGGVETLISHPAIMTHASVPAERRAALGITDGLIRISVGIEDADDLIEDLRRPRVTRRGWGWGWGLALLDRHAFDTMHSPACDASPSVEAPPQNRL